MRPSAAATPSNELRSPLRLRVFTSGVFPSPLLLFPLPLLLFPLLLPLLLFPLLLLLLLLFDESPFLLAVGKPVELESRVTERVNAASRSSRRRMHRAGTRPISVFSVESLILQQSHRQNTTEDSREEWK
jgi:hypothetical protein